MIDRLSCRHHEARRDRQDHIDKSQTRVETRVKTVDKNQDRADKSQKRGQDLKPCDKRGSSQRQLKNFFVNKSSSPDL